jgi:hypothetical protein
MGTVKADTERQIEADDIGREVASDVIHRLRDVCVAAFKGAHERDDGLLVGRIGALLGYRCLAARHATRLVGGHERRREVIEERVVFWRKGLGGGRRDGERRDDRRERGVGRQLGGVCRRVRRRFGKV